MLSTWNNSIQSAQCLNYLYVKGALLLVNSLAQISYIKVPRIHMPKYKESKSRSSLLKNAKLLSTCRPKNSLV